MPDVFHNTTLQDVRYNNYTEINMYGDVISVGKKCWATLAYTYTNPVNRNRCGVCLEVRGKRVINVLEENIPITRNNIMFTNFFNRLY